MRGHDDADARRGAQRPGRLDGLDEQTVRTPQDDELDRLVELVAQAHHVRAHVLPEAVLADRREADLRERRAGAVGAGLGVLLDEPVLLERRK